MSEQTQKFPKQYSGDKAVLDAELLEAIARARAGLRFGSIEITVHEGKVTQIERKEKFRFQS